MKKLYTLLTCAIATMAIVSCSKEIENNAETPEAKLFPMTITATSTETKTELVDRVSIKWLSTDKLSVFDGAGNQEFTSNGEGKTVTFSGETTGAETYYALYPYNETATLSGTTVATTLPSNQEAKAGSFADGLNINASKSATTEFTFTNVLSVAKISIAAANLDDHTIKSVELSSTYPLAGDVVVSYGENITAAAGTNAVNAITLEGAESGLSDGDYYFCLLPNAGGDITLTFTDTEGQTATKTASLGKAFTAGTIKNLGTVKGLTWSKKYSIVFGNNANGATPISASTRASTVISSGINYVTVQPFFVEGNAYYGDTKTSIRVGKSKTAAKLSIELSEEGSVCAQQVIVNCAPMNESNMGGTLSVNDQNAQSVPDEAGDLVFDLGNIDITTIDLSTTKATYVYSIDVVYIEKESVSLEFSPSTVSLTYGEEFAAPVLSSTPSGLTVSYSSSNTNVATVETTTGAVTIVAPGTTTITANFPGSDTYKSGSASYTIIVNDPNANDGSVEKPYTASEAIAIAEALGEDTIENVYVRGIVSTTGTVNTKYNSVTYYISDDGSTSHQFEIYSGLYLNGENFTDANNVRLGDYVVVCGTLKYYNEQAEFDYNSQIKDILRAPSFNPDGGSFTDASQSVTINAESGAEIRYTTGETLPTSTTGTVYSGAITVTETTTINALAVKDGKVTGVVSKTFSKTESESQSVTFDFSSINATVTGGWTGSHTVSPITINATNANTNKAGQVRFQKDGTVTFTGATITRIEIINSGNYPGDFEANVGNYSLEGNNGIWTGSATEVVLTNNGNGTHTTSIIVTYQ